MALDQKKTLYAYNLSLNSYVFRSYYLAILREMKLRFVHNMQQEIVILYALINVGVSFFEDGQIMRSKRVGAT